MGIKICPVISPGIRSPPPKPIPQTRLEPVVITARDMPELTSQTPGGTGVIIAEEIDRHPPVSLTNITRQIPGVEKTTDSPWGSEINIRGLSRNSVLFLVDGCRVNTATDINARFGLVNPYDIERIEVLKGPISALYGWGAMGGVVNVITRKGGYADIAKTREQIWVRASSNPEGYGVFGQMVFESPDLWILGGTGYKDFNETKSAGSTTIHNSQFRDVYARFGSGYLWNSTNETEGNIQMMEGKNIGIPAQALLRLPKPRMSPTLPPKESWPASPIPSPRNPGCWTLPGSGCFTRRWTETSGLITSRLRPPLKRPNQGRTTKPWA